jgi:hypothetical protein
VDPIEVREGSDGLQQRGDQLSTSKDKHKENFHAVQEKITALSSLRDLSSIFEPSCSPRADYQAARHWPTNGDPRRFIALRALCRTFFRASDAFAPNLAMCQQINVNSERTFS